MDEPKVTSSTNYKSWFPILCHKIPKPRIRNNKLHNSRIGFMVHYFHSSLWDFAIYSKKLTHNSFGLQPINMDALGLINNHIGDYIPSMVDEHFHPPSWSKSCTSKSFLVHCVPNGCATRNDRWECNEPKRFFPRPFKTFRWISNDKNYSKFNISCTLGLKFSNSPSLNAFQKSQECTQILLKL